MQPQRTLLLPASHCSSYLLLHLLIRQDWALPSIQRSLKVSLTATFGCFGAITISFIHYSLHFSSVENSFWSLSNLAVRVSFLSSLFLDMVGHFPNHSHASRELAGLYFTFHNLCDLINLAICSSLMKLADFAEV